MSASDVKWVRLGDYIEEYKETLGNCNSISISGVHMEKGFIPTVADITEVDTSKYKIAATGSFACNLMHIGRDVTFPLAYNDSRESKAVSPAYYIFKVKHEKYKELLSEYLYLLLKRSEFGRLTWFHTDSSIRGNLPISELLNIQIPLPDITIQKELVAAYNGLKQLAEENEALIEPLQNACQAYVVDCKAKYPMVKLGEYIEEENINNEASLYGIDDVKGISTDKCFIDTKANLDGVSLNSYKVVNPMWFAYVADTSRRGEKIALALNTGENGILISSIYTTFKCKKEIDPSYLYILLSRSEFDRYSRFHSWGSARETFDWADMCRVDIPLPPIEVQEAIVDLYQCLEEAKRISSEAREQLKTLCPALVQRASKN